MIWTLEHLVKDAQQSQSQINGRWVPARPYPAPFVWRLKAAWEVLRGRADAFTWPEGQ
jgi:hypothetical protein